MHACLYLCDEDKEEEASEEALLYGDDVGSPHDHNDQKPAEGGRRRWEKVCTVGWPCVCAAA